MAFAAGHASFAERKPAPAAKPKNAKKAALKPEPDADEESSDESEEKG